MKEFKVGSFYKHQAGRAIAVLSEVNTFKWGKMLVIEETDITGHGISCMEKGTGDAESNWVEIGKPEWDRCFKKIHVCVGCESRIMSNQEFKISKYGPIHVECVEKIASEPMEDEPCETVEAIKE